MKEFMIASSTCTECNASISVVLECDGEPVMPEACPGCGEREYQAEPDDCLLWDELEPSEREGVEQRHGSFAWMSWNEDGSIKAEGTGQI